MGRCALTCCALQTCTGLGPEGKAGLAPWPPSSAAVPENGEAHLLDFCAFLRQKNLGDGEVLLGGLGSQDSSPVGREAFLAALARLGFPGDAGRVFDALDVGGAGAVPLGQLRAQLQQSAQACAAAPLASPLASEKGRAQGKAKGKRDRPPGLSETLTTPSCSQRTTSALTNATPDVGAEPALIVVSEAESLLAKQSTPLCSPFQSQASPQQQSFKEEGGYLGSEFMSNASDTFRSPVPTPESAIDGRDVRLSRRQQNRLEALGTRGSINSNEHRQRSPKPSSRLDSMVVTVPLAADDDEDGCPSVDLSSYVALRPLPYVPVQPEEEDGNEQRTFVHKGRLVVVPLLPLHLLNGEKESKAGNRAMNWGMVKSKVVGGPGGKIADVAQDAKLAKQHG